MINSVENFYFLINWVFSFQILLTYHTLSCDKYIHKQIMQITILYIIYFFAHLDFRLSRIFLIDRDANSTFVHLFKLCDVKKDSIFTRDWILFIFDFDLCDNEKELVFICDYMLTRDVNEKITFFDVIISKKNTWKNIAKLILWEKFVKKQ
jgi:hypothetical protein